MERCSNVAINNSKHKDGLHLLRIVYTSIYAILRTGAFDSKTPDTLDVLPLML